MTISPIQENTLKQRYLGTNNALSRLLACAPYYPRVSDNKTAAIPRPPEYAIRWPYMQVNRRDMVSWLIFDIDHNDTLKWEKVGLPPPNLIVSTKDGSSSHIFYAIRPVYTGNKGRSHPIRYMQAVHEAIASRLEADPAYHSGPVAKTPGHPYWRTWELHAHVYQLGELHEYVDLPTKRPWSKGPNLVPVSHSRNCTLFEELRFYAYSIVSDERASGNYERFVQRLSEYANRLNDFGRRGYLDLRKLRLKGNLPLSELRATVKSVSRWTWDRYTGGARCNRGVMKLDADLSLQERQRLSAVRTHAERQKGTESKIRAACAILRAKGEKVTQVAVSRIAGVARQTVAAYRRVLVEQLLPQRLESTVQDRFTGTALVVKFDAYQISGSMGRPEEFAPLLSDSRTAHTFQVFPGAG